MRPLQSFVFLASLLATSVGCDPAVQARGTVRDETGTPVPNAEVTLAVAGSERTGYARTDSMGHFAVTRLGGYRLPAEVRVCHGAYEVAARELGTQEALRESLQVVLKRRSPSSGNAPERPGRC